jgi:hypothetical protein
MIPVTLTIEEITTLEVLADLRHRYDRENGVVDKKVGGQSGKDTDFIGICAEFAFCKYFNIYPDIGVTTPKPYDCILKGRTVDVKGTRYDTGKLILRQTDNHVPCDFYALVTGSPPLMTIRGFMTRPEFINEKHLGRLKPEAPLSYIATQDELREFKTKSADSGK